MGKWAKIFATSYLITFYNYWREVFALNSADYVKAFKPVTSFPTISVCTSSVPS